MKVIRLHQNREKSVLHRHPWVFESAIAKVDADIVKGEVVRVTDHSGGFLAYGYYNPKSRIALRLLEWDEGACIDSDWWETRIKESIERRHRLFQSNETDAFRITYGEADYLPGLIADRFGDTLVLGFLTAGVNIQKDLIANCYQKVLNPSCIYERSDADVRELEGLKAHNGLLRGKLPDSDIIIRENGISYRIDILSGQKTGFYLDQRNNRSVVASLAQGLEVLDCFCFSGGFSLSAKRNGAKRVISVDSSASALELLKQNYRHNDLEVASEDIVEADVFQYLRDLRDNHFQTDMVILDPPKLAATKAHIEKAVKAYKDLNLSAIRLIRKGGVLVCFSCSGGVDMNEFRRLVGWAAHDAHREIQIIAILSQGEDHPIRMSYPESEYLKGLVCRVL